MPARGLAGFVVVFAALAVMPTLRDLLDLPLFYLVFASSVLFWTAQATSWNILSGFSGYFSFGQGAFFGVGVYTTAVLVGRQGFDFLATIPLAGLLAVLLALAIGGLAFRLRSLRGEIFALLTLAVPFILASLGRITPAIDGGQGIVLRVPRYPGPFAQFQDLVFYLSLAVAALAVAVAYGMQHSRFGWALYSIRDAESVAEGLGVPTFRYKMLAISATGLIAGLAGSVFALQVGFVTVEGTFGLTVPLLVIVMSVLGGRSHWLGPAIGGALIVTLQDRLAAVRFEGWSLVILGAILATLTILAPDGLHARLRARFRPTVAAFVAAVGGLAALRVWGAPLDWLAAGMLAAAIVAFAPSLGRRSPAVVRRSAAHPAAANGPPTGAPGSEPSPSGPSGIATRPARPVSRPVADPGRPVIECLGVTKQFGGVHALEGVSLTVREGELLGLVGPNGSGKTTLVNLISGAFRPSSGSISVEGQSIVGLPAHRIAHLGVARTYQIPRPFESMTVRDNVAIAIMFGRDPRSFEEARRAAQEHLDLVGLTDLADARPHEVNLHERQLLEMARALATRPRILLLDEVLAGLNPVEIDNAAAVVRRIHESGVVIVLVEHLLRVVNQLADRIVVLDGGRSLAEGDPAVVMRDPAVVRAYLGRQAHA